MTKELLTREWVRSFEEESEARLEVFRPAGTDLPLARGRDRIDLRGAQGSRTISGPDDRAQTTTGRWVVDDEQGTLSFTPAGQHSPSKKYGVVSVERDRLVLKRQ